MLAWSAHAIAGDSVIASGGAVNFGGTVASGNAASLDWIHQSIDGELIGVGTSHEEFAGAQLDIARLTGALHVGFSSTLAGIAEAGPASEGASHYTFLRMTADASRALTPVLQIVAGTQYVEADQARTLLARAGAIWLPLASVSVHTEVGDSVGGNLPTRFVTARADYVLHRVRIYVGGSIGRGAQSVVELGHVSYEHFRDGFVGIAIPLSIGSIGLSWDRLDLDSFIRRTVTLTLTIPLGRGV
jgi:hypothetical protein